MLDHCSISHKGGLVLWSRSFTPTSSALGPVNTLVREALLEERTQDEKYDKDGYSIRWTFANDLELIFVVAYQRILQLTYVEDLLSNMKALFIKLFEPFIATFVASLHATASTVVELTSWDFAKAFEGWDKVFDKALKDLEDQAVQDRKARVRPATRAALAPSPSIEDPKNYLNGDPMSEDTHSEQEISRNVETMKTRLRGRGVGTVAGGRRGRKATKGKGVGTSNGNHVTGSESGSDSHAPAPAKEKKAQRKWGNEAPTESDMASLDYSYVPDGAASAAPSAASLNELVDRSSMGRRTADGLYEVKDLDDRRLDADDEDDEILTRAFGAPVKKDAAPAASSGLLGGLFGRLTGSKVLTEQDLAPVLAAMKEHLMKKNVAAEIADKVCESVGKGLVGKKLGGFKGIRSEVREALSDSITRILTPKTSTDLLLQIRSKRAAALSSSALTAPYSMTFVGVNGVGKSTNLSKVAFWLLQNGLDVLIAACDTFRSGAVEQLRVHVRNLGMLCDTLGGEGGSGRRRVELYEKGYGKDAAGIAREAIAHAKDNGFDVVLIDTAGRMQDNEPLMRALAKLVSVNNPDKIIFVGEALVGNEAVDQLSKFDRALRDFSSAGSATGRSARGIDGMLLTKWDTVDDKVGAALSMTYVTGQPILFVGCGQTYTDLRQLRVRHIVQALLRD